MSSSAGGREAFEALLAEPEPLSSGCGGTRSRPRRSTTPEARAGLKQRLIEHAAGDRPTPTSPALPRRLARPLRRAASARSAAARRSLYPRRAWQAKDGRFVPPEKPPGRRHAAASARPGSSRRPPRALLVGFTSTPRNCPPMRAARPPADRRPRHRAGCATSWSTPPSPAQRLIATALPPYWRTTERRAERPLAPMGFSFTRRDSDPDRARSDLAAAVEIIAATRGSRAGPGRRNRTAEAGFAPTRPCDEQQRLIAAQQGLQTTGWRHSPAPTKRRREHIWRKTKLPKSTRPRPAMPR